MKKGCLNNILEVLGIGILLAIVLIILEGYGFTIDLTSTMGIITYGIISIIVFIYLTIKMSRRQKFIVSILNDQVDPDLFLKELQLDIDRIINKNHKNLLLVNKSAALFYKGEFYGAIKLLESLDPSKFNLLFKSAYYNNLISALLEVNELGKAKHIFNSHPSILSPTTKNRELNLAIKSTMATLDFYHGKLLESRRQFNGLLLENPHNSVRISILYYLGQIDLKEGEIDLGRERLKKAAELGKNTYIAQRAEQLI